MKATRFFTDIEEDRIIRLPEGVTVSTGQAEVIVLQTDSAASETPPTAEHEPLAHRLARLAEEHGIGNLPADLAENHDHYAHGAPKGADAS